jgi:hypothetical protein
VSTNLPSINPTTPAAAPEPEGRWQFRWRWRWMLTIVAVVFLYLMWQCGSALLEGHKLADAATQRFHQQLNAGQYETICEEADEGFGCDQKRDELVKFLSAVHRKLGNAGEPKFVRMNVNATTNGTFTSVVYETKFAMGDATETFTWIKKEGSLKLRGYSINSMALVVD